MKFYRCVESSNRSSGFIFTEISDVLLDRLDLFPVDAGLVLNVGCGAGHFAESLLKRKFVSSLDQLVQYDISYHMLCNVQNNCRIVAEEERLPFPNDTFDAVVSNVTLHNVKNLSSVLLNIYNVMKSKGVFIASLFGNKTLYELKHSMIRAEMDVGVVPRIIPFIHVQDLIFLLQKSGYADIVVDVNIIKIEYNSIHALFRDLRTIDQGTVLCVKGEYPLTKIFIRKTFENYKQYFSADKVNISATFEVVTLKGSKV
ncbi:MAG: methyltransferase domain-containing protein [Ehrlichia sp.]